MNKAMCLQQKESDDEVLKQKFMEQIVVVDTKMQTELSIFQSDMRITVEKLSNTVRRLNIVN